MFVFQRTKADEQPPKGVCSIRLLAQRFMFIFHFISESIAHAPSLAQTQSFSIFRFCFVKFFVVSKEFEKDISACSKDTGFMIAGVICLSLLY
jgi:hypothetical protein